MLFGKSKRPVGCDIGSYSVKIVELKPYKKGEYELLHLGVKNLPPDTIVDGAIIDRIPVANAIKSIYDEEKIKNNKIATSISGHSVIIKRINVPAQREEELEESIEWEVEQYIPFDLMEVNLDYQVVKTNPGDGTMDVIVVAVKKEKVEDQVSVINLAGKEAALIDVDAFALHNAFLYNYPESSNFVTVLLNVGASITNLVIVKGEEVLFTRDLSIGGNQYTSYLQKGLGISYEDAEKLKKNEITLDGISQEDVKNIIMQVSETLELELRKTFDFFKSSNVNDNIDKMVVSGGAVHTVGLVDFLTERLRMPIEIFNSFKRINYDPMRFPKEKLKDLSPKIAVAMGLAMRNL